MSNKAILFILALIVLLLSKFIGLKLSLLVVGAMLVLILAYTTYDRKRNPKKWEQIDKEIEEKKAARKLKAEQEEEENRPKVAAKFWERYLAAIRYIPKSEWILMSKDEKAAIFKERENIKETFFKLPIKTREYIVKKYKLDTRFRNI